MFTQFSRNFGHFSHFWANFYMLGIKMHVLELRNSLVILSKISHACSRNFTQFHAIFKQFGLFQPFLGQFQHVGYQKACTRAEKIIGNTFKKFHARVHAISRNFTQFSRNFGYFNHFWDNFYMLGIKMHVPELRNSLVIPSKNFTHVVTQFHANFTQFSCNLDYFSHFWANFNMLGIKKHILELRNSLVVLGEAIGLKKGPKTTKKRPKASKWGQRPPKALRRSWNKGRLGAPVF